MRKNLKASDPFDFPPNIIPRGMSYQWCAKTLFGKPHAQFKSMIDGGWTPVPGVRHPGVFQTFDDEGNVFVGGQVLMCRSTEQTKEAQEKNHDDAYLLVGSGRSIDVVLDLHISLSNRQVSAAKACGLSSHQYAIRLVSGMADGMDENLCLGGVGGGAHALEFKMRRRPRHRWLQRLFYWISTEQ